jgi:eukaryotic-like serine/threonine-protein kinase
MAGGRSNLAAFVDLPTIGSLDERREVARKSLALLATLAEREPAPLEGVRADQLLRAVRVALADGVLTGDLGWLSPASSAVALFELAQALPAGAERRELGRRVLERLRTADRDTFVRLLVALARSSPRVVASEGLRARLQVVLAAPLTAPSSIGELALGLLAQPTLAHGWIEEPATGSLPARRLAARILAHGAREALRRHDTGDRGGTRVLARPGARAALARLLGDREALVWRFAAIARGLLAHVDSALADDIDRELRPGASNTELRHAAASAAAALERGGAARRWQNVLVARAGHEPGVARGAILGLAGLALVAPSDADDFACELVALSPLEGCESLAELRHEEQADLLPRATTRALEWTAASLRDRPASGDDTQWALLEALHGDLSDSSPRQGLAVPLAALRAALHGGHMADALHHARSAVDEIHAAGEWFQGATDDHEVDRRHSMRLLRELDRELLADNALDAALSFAADADPTRARFAAALATIEAALLEREREPEPGTVSHGGLRLARLRALVRLLDGVRATSEADLEPRLAAMRQLMQRAAHDRSSLRRAVWAAMTRAGDALIRDGHAVLTDLLLAWTTSFPDEDFTIVREASMVPDLELAFDAYGRLEKATWEASDPDDLDAVRAVVERLGELADALPPEQSPRVESVRLALARLSNLLVRLVGAASQQAIAAGTFDDIAAVLGTCARRVFGARERLGLPASDDSDRLETAVRAIETTLATHRAAEGGARAAALDEAIAGTIDVVRAAMPAALAATIERVFVRLSQRPVAHADAADSGPLEIALPSWVPLSRLVGGFYVLRSIGRGTGGSVLLGVRADQRTRPDRELVALKAPDYSGDAARAVSEAEFERMFREEASALLALPAHPNIARFITFDASAQPKPILVMEYVRGTNLDRALETGDLTMTRALQIIDDLLAGLEAMHAARIAHLDIKPANILLRHPSAAAVLVDFGLAGRNIRTGCGSPHYAAAEVWAEATADASPLPADIYAAACVAYEVLTSAVLIAGDSLHAVVAEHNAPQPGARALRQLERDGLGALAELLRAAVARDPRRRPTASRLRAGLRAIDRELRTRRWPLAA